MQAGVPAGGPVEQPLRQDLAALLIGSQNSAYTHTASARPYPIGSTSQP